MVVLVTAAKLGLLYSKVYGWENLGDSSGNCRPFSRLSGGTAPAQRPDTTHLSDVESRPPSHKQDVAQHAGGAAVCSAHWASTPPHSEDSVTVIVSAAAAVTTLLSRPHTVVMATACVAADLFFFSDRVLRVNCFLIYAE